MYSIIPGTHGQSITDCLTMIENFSQKIFILILVDGSPATPMINPIEGITSFVSKKTNTEVAMGARKNSKGKKGGFFFKVGKFEISKNKH